MRTASHNAACALLGCQVPVVLAGMGGASRHELVSAVTKAGGFGFLGMVRESPDLIASEVAHLYALGHRHFGVNIIPAATEPRLLERQVMTCIELRVPVVGLFWDIDDHVVAQLRAADITVVYQVGSVDEAIAAERAGAQIIIAQGREAGGHVRGVRPLAHLLPDVADAVSVPVLAAGGLATGADLIVSQALGADGIVLGTALLATVESYANDHHKRRLLAAASTDTILTDTFHINWPPEARVRVLKSAVTRSARRETPEAESIVIGEEDGRPIYLFSTDSPLRDMTGDFEAMALYAGTGVGEIESITGAGDRIASIVTEAAALVEIASEQLQPESSSSVCYAGEMSGSYMGHLSSNEISDNLNRLLAELRGALHILLHQSSSPLGDVPPFTDCAAGYALWIARLRAELGSHNTPDSPPVVGQLSLLHAGILHRLSGMIPRLPDNATRSALAQLREFIEARRADDASRP